CFAPCRWGLRERRRHPCSDLASPSQIAAPPAGWLAMTNRKGLILPVPSASLRAGCAACCTCLWLHFRLPETQAARPWQRLYFLPEPHGQGSLRPILRPLDLAAGTAAWSGRFSRRFWPPAGARAGAAGAEEARPTW